MDSLLKRIIEEVTRPYHRLSLVSCPDGFLQRDDTIRAFAEQASITVRKFSQLELRVWFETEFQENADKHYIVILENTDNLITDIRQQAFVTEFNTRDLLLNYNQQAIDFSKINYQIIAHLYENKSVVIMDRAKTDMAIEKAEAKYGKDGDDVSVVKEHLKQIEIEIDWKYPLKSIESISQQVVKVARQGKYTEIENVMELINLSFQHHLDDVYYSQLITAVGPKVVHKILPHIARTYGVGQKVALVVVDGLSYWQSIILKQYLSEANISTKDDVCYAWIPSVTQLSRQAIFRGATPDRNYNQSPANEEKLWREFWYSRSFEEWHVMYAYDKLPHIPDSIERLAFVTMTMDDDMHSAHGIKQLYRSTEDWAKSFVPTIRQILDAGFEIVLTADHGGVPSHGWRSLTQKEKNSLYETGSRGLRHLIFSNQNTMQNFINDHSDENKDWLCHGDAVVWRDNKCFSNDDCITHGGSHVLEILVPLMTIKLEK